MSKVVAVYVSARPDCLLMSVDRAHRRLVNDFFAGVSVDDVWAAAQTQAGWQGTIDGAVISIIEHKPVLDSDVVLQ
jgi:hypothetical protein